LRAAIDESGARISTGTLPVVNADATQMEQLLQNLIGNAIKFRKGPAPSVHIDARREDAAWRIRCRMTASASTPATPNGSS
jgi:light-regulated signal transduction histidine kinase (bacteriophytochrome)